MRTKTYFSVNWLLTWKMDDCTIGIEINCLAHHRQQQQVHLRFTICNFISICDEIRKLLTFTQCYHLINCAQLNCALLLLPWRNSTTVRHTHTHTMIIVNSLDIWPIANRQSHSHNACSNGLGAVYLFLFYLDTTRPFCLQIVQQTSMWSWELAIVSQSSLARCVEKYFFPSLLFLFYK